MFNIAPWRMACRVSGVPRLLASLRIAAVTGFLTVEGGACCIATGALADTGTTTTAAAAAAGGCGGTDTDPSTADGADDDGGASAGAGIDGAVVAHGVDANVGFVTSTLFFLKSA